MSKRGDSKKVEKPGLSSEEVEEINKPLTYWIPMELEKLTQKNLKQQ